MPLSKSIAKSCLISSMTVSRVINQRRSDVGQSSFDALPEHLMMDEFKSVKNVTGKMSFIYADLCIAPHRRCGSGS